MGMLANKPMQKDVKAAMAAVAVTKSRLTTWVHIRYSWLVAHRSSMLSAGQMQVPPLSDTIDAGDYQRCPDPSLPGHTYRSQR